MSEQRDPAALTVSGNQPVGLTAETTRASHSSAPSQDYQADAAAKYNLRVERDPDVTHALAEDSMAQVRASLGIGAGAASQSSPAVGAGLANEAQRHARMAELATFTQHPELSTALPQQEQVRDALPAVHPGQSSTLENLKGAAAQPEKGRAVLGKFTAMVLGRGRQQGVETSIPTGRGS